MSDRSLQRMRHNRTGDPIALATEVHERLRHRKPLNDCLLDLIKVKDEPVIDDLFKRTGLHIPLTKVRLGEPTNPLDPTLDQKLPSPSLAMFYHCLHPGRPPGIITYDTFVISPPVAFIFGPNEDPIEQVKKLISRDMPDYHYDLTELCHTSKKTLFIDTKYESIDPELANKLLVIHPTRAKWSRMKVLKRGQWIHRAFELAPQSEQIRQYYSIKEEFQDVLR